MHDKGWHIAWGDAAGWITGVSTVLLAAVTAWGLWTQRQEIRRQQRALDDQQEQLNEQRELTRQHTALITAQLRTHRAAQARKVDARLDVANLDLAGQGHGHRDDQ